MSWIRQTNDGSYEIAELILGGIIPFILIIIGTIGNILCILYLIRRKHRRSPSTYVYLIFLFLADTLSLYQWNLNYIVMQFSDGKPLTERSLFLCRSIAFLSFYTIHLSTIFLTLIALDRTLLLWSRYYRFNLTKRLHAFIISIFVLIIIFTLDGFILSLGTIDENTKEITCYYTSNANLMNFYGNIFPWIHLILLYIIPFIIMIIGIILIIIKVYNRRVHAHHIQQKQRLSLMLVSMFIVYIILTLPNRLCFTVFFSSILNHIYTDTILLASNTLLYTRNATNVCFLFISSTTFRKDLIKFCCCCCQRRQANRVIPIQQIQTSIRTDHCHASN